MYAKTHIKHTESKKKIVAKLKSHVALITSYIFTRLKIIEMKFV
jgi:hypothetical protein